MVKPVSSANKGRAAEVDASSERSAGPGAGKLQAPETAPGSSHLGPMFSKGQFSLSDFYLTIKLLALGKDRHGLQTYEVESFPE